MATQRVEELHERPVGELLKQLSEETSTLVRQELALAKAEMAQKGKRVGIGAGEFGAAGLLGFGAFGVFTAFLVLVLAEAVDAWLSALIVLIVYLAAAGVLALMGKNKVQQGLPPKPEETIESVKEDVAWAKTRTQSGRR